MPVPYKKMVVFYPPRPEGSVPPDRLGDYPGWWAQRKFNGTRTLIFLSPEGDVELRGRHQEPLKAYDLSPAMEGALQALAFPRGSWSVLDAELLHSKTRGPKDRMVLFDVLVFAGVYQTQTTYECRYNLLVDVCGHPRSHEGDTGRRIALKVNENVWLAESFRVQSAGEARALYESLIDLDEIEGLMLKDPGGRLQPGFGERNNSSWLIRVRKPHKNYKF